MSKAPGKNAAARRKDHDRAAEAKIRCTFKDSEEEPRKKHLRKTGEYVRGEHLQTQRAKESYFFAIPVKMEIIPQNIIPIQWCQRIVK